MLAVFSRSVQRVVWPIIAVQRMCNQFRRNAAKLGAVGDALSDLPGPGIEPHKSLADRENITFILRPNYCSTSSDLIALLRR